MSPTTIWRETEKRSPRAAALTGAWAPSRSRAMACLRWAAVYWVMGFPPYTDNFTVITVYHACGLYANSLAFSPSKR